MNRIAKFEKVSFEQFEKDWLKNFPETEDVKAVYDSIKLPERATSGSAGYDFYAPVDVTFEKGKSLLIPTGIRSKIEDGWVLSIYPRSGLGFKHRCQLDNTVGISQKHRNQLHRDSPQEDQRHSGCLTIGK